MNTSIDPKHYRTHPSGVEAIEVAENLGFNMGNAFKYLYRCGQKGSAIEDLRKVEWYLRRRAGTWKPMSKIALFFLGDPYRDDFLDDIQKRIIQCEDRYMGHMAAALRCIMLDDPNRALGYVSTIIRVEEHRIFSLEDQATLFNEARICNLADWSKTEDSTIVSRNTGIWIKIPDIAHVLNGKKFDIDSFKQIVIR